MRRWCRAGVVRPSAFSNSMDTPQPIRDLCTSPLISWVKSKTFPSVCARTKPKVETENDYSSNRPICVHLFILIIHHRSSSNSYDNCIRKLQRSAHQIPMSKLADAKPKRRTQLGVLSAHTKHVAQVPRKVLASPRESEAEKCTNWRT